MSSTRTAGNENYLYKSTESELLNGFVAGIAGSSLQDGLLNSDVSFGNKATVRLSATSSSFGEELECRNSEASLTEGIEMRISDGSIYPSPFSFLDISDCGTIEDSEATLNTNCSTIDVTLDDIPEQSAAQDLVADEDCVFCPHFNEGGNYRQRQRQGSDSSIESFGAFDEPSSWREDVHLLDDTHLAVAMEQCFHSNTIPTVIHSSPNKLLQNNFVWMQVRSNVTKPSYVWDKLKLHSYLLGALGVRKPISLNRLKSSTCGKPTTTPTTYTLSKRHYTTSEVSESVAPSITEGETECEDDIRSMSEISGWNSSTSDVSEHNYTNIQGCCKPCVPSVLQRRLSSHRRVNSSPANIITTTLCRSITPSPDTLSLTGSPGVFRQIVKSASAETSPSSSFDELHAVRGLSLLHLEDIISMRNEMKARVAELSTTLITEFVYRGDADHSREVKKAFVSSLLLAEEKKSKSQLSTKQLKLLPIPNRSTCPSTEILVLLTQLLTGLINDTQHTPDLLKHYMLMFEKG